MLTLPIAAARGRRPTVGFAQERSPTNLGLALLTLPRSRTPSRLGRRSRPRQDCRLRPGRSGAEAVSLWLLRRLCGSVEPTSWNYLRRSAQLSRVPSAARSNPGFPRSNTCPRNALCSPLSPFLCPIVVPASDIYAELLREARHRCSGLCLTRGIRVYNRCTALSVRKREK
jgi:hypothetical protein